MKKKLKYKIWCRLADLYKMPQAIENLIDWIRDFFWEDWGKYRG